MKIDRDILFYSLALAGSTFAGHCGNGSDEGINVSYADISAGFLVKNFIDSDSDYLYGVGIGIDGYAAKANMLAVSLYARGAYEQRDTFATILDVAPGPTVSGNILAPPKKVDTAGLKGWTVDAGLSIGKDFSYMKHNKEYRHSKDASAGRGFLGINVGFDYADYKKKKNVVLGIPPLTVTSSGTGANITNTYARVAKDGEVYMTKAKGHDMFIGVEGRYMYNTPCALFGLDIRGDAVVYGRSEYTHYGFVSQVVSTAPSATEANNPIVTESIKAKQNLGIKLSAALTCLYKLSDENLGIGIKAGTVWSNRTEELREDATGTDPAGTAITSSTAILKAFTKESELSASISDYLLCFVDITIAYIAL